MRLPIDLMKCILVVSHLAKDGIGLCIEQLMNLRAAPAGHMNISYVHHFGISSEIKMAVRSEGITHFCFLSSFLPLGKRSSIIETEETVKTH